MTQVTEPDPIIPPEAPESTVRASRWRAYLELIRLPNVFTALADVIMGAFFAWWYFGAATMKIPPIPWGLFAMLLGASACLYWGGMVLNDVFDFEKDRQQRPHRPLPSGRIPRRVAGLWGIELLVVGVLLGWGVSLLGGGISAGVAASLLAVCIYLYDGPLKQTPAGPIAMGGCRFLNVLLGMSLMPIALDTPHYWVAGGMGLYVAGLTWFARTEAAASSRLQLAGGTLVLVAGVAMLAAYPASTTYTSPAEQIPNWNLFWSVLGTLIAWRCIRAILDPRPATVQFAVKQCIFSIIVLDAVIVFGVTGNWIPAVATAALLLPAMFLGRFIYST